MSASPKHIRALQEQGRLEIEWPGGAVHHFPYRFLRGRCPCAACVDEMTGERVVDVEGVPENVKPAALEFAGNYALKVHWSDGHDTGLYTWDYLQSLAADERVLTGSSTQPSA